MSDKERIKALENENHRLRNALAEFQESVDFRHCVSEGINDEEGFEAATAWMDEPRMED